MTQGKVHSIQTLGTIDGPGVRFVVFLQGCNLRCSCCHNPDTWAMDGGTLYKPEEILQKVIRYKEYFGEEGGITISGGEPLLRGGTGSLSVLQEMPEDLPDRLEAGTPNVPGIAGLLKGINFVSRIGVERIGRHERTLARTLAGYLRGIDNVTVYLSDRPERQTGVVSFVVNGADCERVGEWLGKHGAALRAGLHCAPTAHISAGTLETGTVRASISIFNTPQEMEQTAILVRRFKTMR